MSTNLLKIFLTILVAVFVINTKIELVSAQGLVVQGLSIDPFLIELNMVAGQSQYQLITLTNTTDKPLTFNASINDFIINGNSGQPIFLKLDENSDPKYSLSQWIKVTKQPNFTILPKGKTEVGWTVTVPNNAEPGTHYGGILFGPPSEEIDITGSLVQHKAGALILVKLGESNEKVQVQEFFTQQHIYQSGPVDFIVSIHNFGNVHSKPKGDITIRNFWGGQVAQVPVNRDALIILPESVRDFAAQWDNNLSFGKYTAEMVLYYGIPKLELRSQTTFWIIPLKEIALGMLSLLILGIIIYIGVRRYNRFIINHSHDKV